MSASRAPDNRTSTAASWRRAVVCLLILFAAIAPAARAACELDRLAGQLGTNGADSAITVTGGSLGLTSGRDCSCCLDEAQGYRMQAPALATDGSLWLAPPTPPAVSAASSSLTLRTAFLGPVMRRHALPPTERVFRRVPRLLV
jgi:hypothetical protein